MRKMIGALIRQVPTNCRVSSALCDIWSSAFPKISNFLHNLRRIDTPKLRAVYSVRHQPVMTSSPSSIIASGKALNGSLLPRFVRWLRVMGYAKSTNRFYISSIRLLFEYLDELPATQVTHLEIRDARNSATSARASITSYLPSFLATRMARLSRVYSSISVSIRSDLPSCVIALTKS
jgi:hypothetical protein